MQELSAVAFWFERPFAIAIAPETVLFKLLMKSKAFQFEYQFGNCGFICDIPATRRLMMSAWRKWRFGGMISCNTIATVVAIKDDSEPMNVGIATTRSIDEAAMV